MTSLTVFQKQVEDTLFTVSSDNYPEFEMILFSWYKQLTGMYHLEPPNITDLIESDESHINEQYREMLFNLIATDLVENCDWETETDLDCRWNNSQEIICENYELFCDQIEMDVKKILGMYQIFYAENYETTCNGNEISFDSESFHNSPLQEVW